MARTYNDIYYNDDENSTAEILDDMKKLAESVDQQIGSIKSFNNDTSQFIEQVTPLMNTLSEQVIDMHQLADTMFTELEQVKEENKQLREDLNGLPKGQASGESIDLSDSAEMRCELKISGNSVQDGEPTPDEPVEVESCGDNINIFDKDNASVLKGYISGSTNTTAFVTTDNSNKCIYIPCKPNKAYTVSKVSSERFRIATTQTIASEVDINKTNNDIATKLTIISRKDDKYLIVYYYCKDYDTLTEQEILNSIKIVEGTETGEYSPYGQGCINEVICNKNLFDKESVLTGTAIQRNTGNILTTSAVSTYSTSDYCKVKSSTTYFLGIAYSSTNYGVVYYDKDKNHISGEKLNNYFTTPSNCEYVRFTWITADYNISTIQLEEGTTATDYVEHKSQTYTIPTQQQQPMRAIGNVRDKFILKENGKWYERHDIARKIFDGTESINTNEFGTNSFTFTLTNIKIKDDEKLSISNYFKGVKEKDRGNSGNNIIYSANPNYIFIRNTNFANLADFKSWLSDQYNAGTPVYVDYVLKEPLDIECTEEQSTILFDIEQNAKTYDKVTHMYSTDNVSPVIDVTYKKDIETLFANTLVEGV